ncbi:MAG: acetyl-CoA carboxylase biotin carboxyl carrier protein subunit [Bacteroidia bacterium]|nr:acetyl-CoA carboxylase biotin carboxyl carrier protein subunit [Bacteroidia bacterium]
MHRLHLEATPKPPSDLRWINPWQVEWHGVRLYLLQHEPGKLIVRTGGQIVEVHWQLPVHRYLERVKLPSSQRTANWELRAPMPGLIREIRVKEGQEVTSHTPAIVLEAMKMENLLFTPAEGFIESILVAPGQAVEKGALLLRLRPHAD